MGAGGMTTVRRPRVRIEVPDVVVEVESKAEVPEEELLTVKGTKRKRAPPTKGPCEHGVKYRSQCKVCLKCEHGRNRYDCKECIASRRGQRTADVSRGPPSQDTEKHARQDTDVDEPSEASENEEPDDPSEVDAAEAAHATTRLIQSGLPGLARYQDAVSSIELRNRRAVIVKQTRALKRRLVGDVDPTAEADEDERDEDERETEDEGEQRRCVIM